MLGDRTERRFKAQLNVVIIAWLNSSESVSIMANEYTCIH